MSWSYSRVLVAEYSEACCSDTELSARLNMTPMPDQFYWPDKTTEHSRLSRFGMTCEPLTENHGGDLLTWFQAASHAKTSAWPETEPDWTAKGQGYGEKWRGLLAKYDPDSCSLKTAQLSLLEDLTGCSATLPRWGLMLDGELYQQPMLELFTAENESGYLPTPRAQEPGRTTEGYGRGLSELIEGKTQRQAPHFWPTPRSNESGNYQNVNRDKNGMSRDIALTLSGSVKVYPTPTASASKGSSITCLVRKDGKLRMKDRLDHAIMHSDGGQLNPPWVEWLMGWPIGQTELKPLATDKFREFVQQHGIYFTDE